METLTLISDYELERNKPLPSLNHSITQSTLLAELVINYRKKFTFLSELSLEMPEKPNSVPDICIYPKMEIDFLHDKISLSQMPLTAIEIVSPSQSNDDILSKFERYFSAGVKSCWLVLLSFKAISVYSAIGVYRFFTESEMLVDQATGIELALTSIFNPDK